MNKYCGIAMLLTVSCVFCGCDGITSINGVVTDDDYKPISGAKVVVVPSKEIAAGSRNPTEVTDANGAFEINFTHAPRAGKIKLIVSHEDYQTVEETLKSGGHRNHNIRMAGAPNIEKELGYGDPHPTEHPLKNRPDESATDSPK
ncbi:MAG: carboxypeptidase-like regulatory domain-containing protein [Schlesneria sp.]